MKTIFGCIALTLAVAFTAIPADAKGCIKGAVVGRCRRALCWSPWRVARAWNRLRQLRVYGSANRKSE